ncbi:MAG: hypothetical protein IPM79_28415 [Polyangiaceae bacterium]|nr:hypothetical protein [Polyangiaceae bacterium]
MKTTPATSDPAVLVVLVKLGVERYFNDEAAVDETFTSESGTDRFAASYGGCARFEYWRVTRAGASVAERRLLAAVCNDGHGAAQVGEEAVFFDGERFQRDKSGGSAWRWAYTKSYSIAPLAPLVDESVGFWTLQENQGKTDWDYRSFSGSYEWTAPRCDASGAAGPGVDTFSGPLVPDVVVDPAFAEGGWRTSRLGACSLSLDDGASATLRAVASRGKVFVEVVDDVVTSVTAPVGDELTLVLTLCALVLRPLRPSRPRGGARGARRRRQVEGERQRERGGRTGDRARRAAARRVHGPEGHRGDHPHLPRQRRRQATRGSHREQRALLEGRRDAGTHLPGLAGARQV